MKKIIIPTFVTLIVLAITVIIIGYNKEIDIEFFSIKENYSFVEKENRKMTLNIYSKTDKPLISYPERNNYLVKLDSQSFKLENVECNINNLGKMYLIKIIADIPDITDSEYISQSFNLLIYNASYNLSLDMGSFSIIDSKYINLLSLDSLSASYSKMENKPYLCGLNLKLSNDYDFLTLIRIGGFSYGMLSRAKFDIKYENEIDIDSIIVNYNYKRIEEDYTLGLKSKELFIPFGYLNDYFIKSGYIVFKIDGNYYYFDNFPFMTTDPILDNFMDKLSKGDYKNA